MINRIISKLNSCYIDRIGIINIEDCEIINQRILPKWSKSAIIFSIPYRSTKDIADDGFSEYARIYDYHNFSKELYQNISESLSNIKNLNFKGFCDHSPINEKIAAAKCGLGVIGRNSLFIDKIYGSFVFIGTILTDIEVTFNAHNITQCSNCGKCVNACPNNAITDRGIDRYKCLSGISQKKSKTQEEKDLLKKYNIIWGCDICQKVCPYNKNATISPMEYFKSTRIEHITKEFISSLSNDEFNKYAFSYKGREIVLNNINFK